MKRNLCLFAVVSLLVGTVVAIAGCQSKSTGANLYPVTGVVTYQGNPVDGARVVFAPTGEAAGVQAAAAQTDAQGRYKIDAAPGEYVVTVTKTKQPEAPAGGGAEYVPPQEGQAPPVPENILPAKYASSTTSPLRFRVEARENTFNIELTD